jgi:CBS domain-containing protein
MTPAAARHFRLELQQARENALKDAEAFEGIIHVVERLGSYRSGSVEGLGKYLPKLGEIAEGSALANELPAQYRHLHTPFRLLFDIVRDARNDALHIGSFARHLTTHAVELSLVLEDALRSYEDNKYIADYMVRDPICAQLWQPVSFVRQQMLTNSFSYLPVLDGGGHWCLLSDLEVARYLQGVSNGERKRRLATPLGDAKEIALIPADRLSDATSLDEALKTFNGQPILVFREQKDGELVGILTSFDLL